MPESRNGKLVSSDGNRPEWGFLTSRAQVLLCISGDPDIRLREIADAVGITERAAHRMVIELGEAGYVSWERVGRRNRYTIHSDLSLPEPLARSQKVGALLDVLRG